MMMTAGGFMKQLRVLFLHGKEGTPEGTKPTFLRDNGHYVIAPVLPKDDWELSKKRALDCLHAFKPHVVVGSSRGGAVACAIDTGYVPKILIAPAWTHFNDGHQPLVDDTTTVLHCPKDDLVKFDDTLELVMKFGVKVLACGEGHRMSDPEALEKLLHTVEQVLYNV